MVTLVIRNLEKSVLARLKRRAKRNGRNLEDEVREILRRAVEHDEAAREGLGTLIARRFAGKGIGIDFEIPESRGEEARPAKFR
ncbi:MAG TPA: plasmid stabilization protein [Xanthobacteraceae bacterium]|nr:plasmid stabilization protein [Xanthobacteraceae bacterium]